VCSRSSAGPAKLPPYLAAVGAELFHGLAVPDVGVVRLDFGRAVVLGAVDNPSSDQVSSPTRTGTSNDDLKF
jgi:hypothetical protein